VIGSRSTSYSLYDQDLVTFKGGKIAYDHRDAARFICLNAEGVFTFDFHSDGRE
jgi:argininosuccinate synthase